MLFTCAVHAPSTESGGGQRVSHGSKSLTVDIHCHCACYAAADFMKAESERAGKKELAYGGGLTAEVNAQQLIDIRPKMMSVDERLADMDRMGVDIQAIAVPPYQFYYWAPLENARDAARIMNDHLAEVAASHPDRFATLATLPMQNTEMAVAELRRCVNDLGMRGAEISTNVNGEELSSPRLAPFFAAAEELDILIFIHPSGFTHAQRFGENYFVNLIGHPLESTLAIGYLVFDGVLDRHPGLKVCVAHGGGYAPAYAGRFDHGFHARPDCRQHIKEPPSSYMRRLYFDTMVFEPDQLEFLIRKYGADHILLGTDYPYDMGEDDPVGLVSRVEGLKDDERAAVCGLNAARLLNLES